VVPDFFLTGLRADTIQPVRFAGFSVVFVSLVFMWLKVLFAGLL
jgi:hypothetical protein